MEISFFISIFMVGNGSVLIYSFILIPTVLAYKKSKIKH